MKMKRTLCALLSIGMMAACFAACTGDDSKDSNSSPSPSSSAANPASPSAAPEERVKLTVVSTDAGIAIPEGVSTSAVSYTHQMCIRDRDSGNKFGGNLHYCNRR